PFRRRYVIEPDVADRPGADQEGQVGRGGGIGGEDALRQAHDRMQVEALPPLFFDTCGNATGEQGRVAHYRAGPATRFRSLTRPLEPAHDQLQEEQRGFRSLHVIGEIATNTSLLLAAEGRIGEDQADAVPIADLAQRKAQAVLW